MKRRTKISVFVGLCVLVLAMGLLTGCGKDKEDGGEDKPGSTVVGGQQTEPEQDGNAGNQEGTPNAGDSQGDADKEDPEGNGDSESPEGNIEDSEGALDSEKPEDNGDSDSLGDETEQPEEKMEDGNK